MCRLAGRRAGGVLVQAIVNGRILMPDCVVTDRALCFDEKIIGLCAPDALPEGCTVIDAAWRYVAPGLVDLHIHGYMGEDVSDAKAEGVRIMARAIARNGVTGWLPTTMTLSKQQLCAAFDNIRTLRQESRTAAWDGAEILGVNAEGPFINPARKGAQNGAHVLLPDAGFVLDFADVIRIVTLAPEMKGGLRFIDALREKTDILISVGHTDATFEQAKEAFAHGARHVTHTFNAMTGLNHRAPGVAGAALTLPVTTELIADAFHVHPGLFPLLVKAKGERLCLVTDCTRAGGMPDGEYTLGGQKIFVHGVECRLADGTIAGSVLRLNEAVRNLLSHTDMPVWEAVNCASRNPAAAIGATNKGTLEVGRDADIFLCDEAFNVSQTILRGRTIFMET